MSSPYCWFLSVGVADDCARKAPRYSNKPVITVDDIGKLPPTWPSQRPDVSGLSSHLLERISKYFAARHDAKTFNRCRWFYHAS